MARALIMLTLTVVLTAAVAANDVDCDVDNDSQECLAKVETDEFAALQVMDDLVWWKKRQEEEEEPSVINETTVEEIKATTEEVLKDVKGGQREGNWCKYPTTISTSLLRGAVGPETKGQTCLGWWNREPAMDYMALDKLQRSLSSYDKLGPKNRIRGLSFRQGEAGEVAQAMYEGSRVEGVSNTGPQVMRGVWWMKHNAMPEELFSTMGGVWFENERALAMPDGPFSWAWPTAKFRNMELGGSLYTAGRAQNLALSTVMSPQVVALNMAKCPEKNKAFYCHDSMGDLSYALMQLHKPFGNLLKTASGIGLGGVHVSSTFTMEAQPAPYNGTSYKRGCYWGVDGCNAAPVGSYDLVKLIDADGNKVEPWWSQWVQYAGSTPMFTFAGWDNPAQRQGWASKMKQGCERSD